MVLWMGLARSESHDETCFDFDFDFERKKFKSDLPKCQLQFITFVHTPLQSQQHHLTFNQTTLSLLLIHLIIIHSLLYCFVKNVMQSDVIIV
jgi:hypothetical protein